MRILFYDFTLPYLLKDSEYPVGGFAVQLGGWIKCFSYTNHKVGVLSFDGANLHVGKALDFDLIDTYDPDKGVKIAKYFYSYIPKLIKGAKSFNADVIIQACAGVNTGIMAFVSSICGVPFVYRVANDMDVDGRCHSRLQKYEQMAFYYGLKKSSMIICQNQYQYDCLKKNYPNKPLHIVHNPYDTTKVLDRVIPRAQRKYIAWLGVFSRQKNLPLLLSIAKALPDVEFRVAGMPASSVDTKTKQALAGLECLKNVIFVGYIKRGQVLEFLSASIALLSTSHYEGFSNTFLESFASSTPVVCPFRVDPDAIITKNNLGLTTEKDDELVASITSIIAKGSDEYADLSSCCRDFLLDNFNPEAKAAQLVSLLSKRLGIT